MNTESRFTIEPGGSGDGRPSRRLPAVCIAGMHRSGTSMVTQLLYRCGLYLGQERHLMNARADNPHGFWEHLEFVTINDDVLNHLGASWDCPPGESQNWSPANFNHCRQKAAIVLQQFVDQEIWGWKDPRNSLTLPFWQELVPDLKVVICLRNPLEVAMSLHERNEVSQTFGLRLWESYQRRLLAAAPRDRRVITHYDAYFNDPQRALLAVLRAVELSVTEEKLATLCAAIQPAMRHHRFTAQDLADVEAPDEITSLYLAMCKEAEWLDDGGDHRAADMVPAAEDVAGQVAASIAPTITLRPGDEQSTGAAPSRGLNWPAVGMEMLRREMESLRPELQRKDELIRELQHRIERGRGEFDGTSDEGPKSGAEPEQPTGDAASAQRELVELRILLHTIFNAKEAVEQTCVALLAELEDARASAQTDHRDAEAEGAVAALVERQSRQVSELRDTVAKQVVRLEAMSAELSEARQELASADEEATDRREKARLELEHAGTAAAELSQRLADEEAAHRHTADELATMQKHAHALLQDREAARADAAELRRALADTAALQDQTAAELATMRTHAHELWQDREAARIEAEELNQELARQAEVQQQTAAELAAMQKHAHELAQEREAASAAQQHTASELAEMQKHAYELLQDRESARREADELRTALSKTDAQQQQIASELAEMQKHAHELLQDRDRARTEADELRAAVSNSDGQQQQITAELAEMQKHAHELLQDRDRAQTEADELRAAVSDSDARQQQIMAELALMQKHADELSHSREAARAEAAELRDRLAATTATQQQVASELATMQKHADGLLGERDAARAETESLRVIAEEVTELRAQLRRSADQHGELLVQVSSAAATADEMRQELALSAEIRRELAEAQSHMERLRVEKETDSGAIAELENQLALRTAEAAAMQQDLVEARHAAAVEVADLRGRLEALESHALHARREHSELLAQLRQSLEQLGSVQSQFYSLAANAQSAEREAAELRAKIAENNLAASTMQTDLADLRQLLARNAASQQQTAAELTTMQQHAHALSEERDAAIQQIASLQNELSSFATAARAAETDALSVRAVLEENKAATRQMREELGQLRHAVTQNAESERRSAELKRESVGQATELAQLRRRTELSTRREGAMREKLFEARDRLSVSEAELRDAQEVIRRMHQAPAEPHPAAQSDLNEAASAPAPEQQATDADPALAKKRAYEQVIHRTRDVIAANLPRDSSVLVVNRGDYDLLHVGVEKLAGPFPQAEGGQYAGHHPFDSESAIAHLEALRSTGAEFLVFPQTAFWWFEHYGQFKQHLDANYPALPIATDACVIFDLREKRQELAAQQSTGLVQPTSDPRRPLAAVTIISRNYLAQARCLAQTFLEQEPTGHFYLLVIDRLPEGVDAGPGIRVIDPDEIDVPDFYGMCFKYDIIEFNTAVKPYCLSLLMNTYGEQEIIYLDPDIVVMRPMDELRDALSRGSIVLTPHVTKPLPDDGLSPSDQDILISGAYNLGFIALRNTSDSQQFLKWWSERLEDGCRIDIARGLFTDQRWIDLVPGMYESTIILRDQTYNVAFWNLHERTIERRGDTFLVNDKPAAFFHISGFNPEKPDVVSKHQSRVQVVAGTGLSELLQWYADMQMRNGYRDSSKWEYGYSRFSNGIWVNPWLRQLYLGLDAEQRASFGDPFEVTGPASFLDWATKPQPDFANLSLFAQSIYRIRYDLPVAFPDVKGKHREAFIEWARLQGPIEMKYESELIRTDDTVPDFLTRGSSGHRIKRIAPMRGMRAHDRLAVHVSTPHANGSATNGSNGKRNGAAKANKRMDPDAYEQLIHRIRDLVRAVVPTASTIVVVSRGDYRLVNFEGFTCWHFPQNEDGVYGGYHPATGQVAIAHLEGLRARGGRYLLLPSTAFWWLDFYPDFREHLEANYHLIVRQEDTCVIYELPQPTSDLVAVRSMPDRQSAISSTDAIDRTASLRAEAVHANDLAQSQSAWRRLLAKFKR
jgi:chromosome segregation ATPase